ncbi:MAG: OadG family protein [Bacteroidales bacterium]|nr:OadG family protein [Bacteroidales bacterium]MDE6236341.1 OadG family protein [Muribaculaceae bacterium]MDE6835658.1 OadG family protein [Muribaculaceae bacterium]
MLKKTFLATALCASLFVTAPAATAAMSAEPQQDTVVAVQGEQTEVTGNWVNSTETNTIQESKIARKMTQAEKAKNAAENDSAGGAITIIAMCIVIGALVVLSILFLIFGKISASAHTRKKKEAHGVDDTTAEEHHDENDSGEVIAAIAMALAEHFGQGHDMEDTILTIKRMRKAYSPWNSKIYNLRQLPDRGAAVASVRRPLKRSVK